MKWDMESFMSHFGLKAQNGSGDGDGAAAAAAAAGYGGVGQGAPGTGGWGGGMGSGAPAGTTSMGPSMGQSAGSAGFGGSTGFGGASATGTSVGMGPGVSSSGTGGFGGGSGGGGGTGARGGAAGVSGGGTGGFGGATGGGAGTAAGGSASGGPSSGEGSADALFGYHAVRDMNKALATMASYGLVTPSWGSQMGTPMQNVAAALLGLEGTKYGWGVNALGGLSYGPTVSPVLSGLSGAAPTGTVQVSGLGPPTAAVSGLGPPAMRGYTPAQIQAVNDAMQQYRMNALNSMAGGANMGFPAAGLAHTPTGGYASSLAAPVGSNVGTATISGPGVTTTAQALNALRGNDFSNYHAVNAPSMMGAGAPSVGAGPTGNADVSINTGRYGSGSGGGGSELMGGKRFAEGGSTDRLYDGTVGGEVPRSASPSDGTRTDDVMARVNDGEFIFPDWATEHFGKNNLQGMLNEARSKYPPLPPPRPDLPQYVMPQGRLPQQSGLGRMMPMSSDAAQYFGGSLRTPMDFDRVVFRRPDMDLGAYDRSPMGGGAFRPYTARTGREEWETQGDTGSYLRQSFRMNDPLSSGPSGPMAVPSTKWPASFSDRMRDNVMGNM